MTHEQTVALIERACIYGNPKAAAELAKEIVNQKREEADNLEAWANSRFSK